VAAPTETLDENLTETIVPAAAAENRTLVMFDRGDEVVVTAGEEGIRFLLVSGQPLREPVSWYGPIVMNTRAEIQRALAELNDGSFIKHRG
ncbi:MAG: pirin-like C-terminal cupin domain-containing protein, partial [Gemmatimonadales bacterium]